MDLEELQSLLKAFRESAFDELTISDGKSTLKLKQPRAVAVQPEPVVTPEVTATARQPETPSSAASRRAVDSTGKVIQSTRVGHFLPILDNHGDPVFPPGELIEEGQTFGMIESMNLRYEVRADRSGVIERYLVEEGDPVEFGQSLVLLR